MEQQKNIERVAIDKKLKTAANMRDENIKKMLERLKEHVCFEFKSQLLKLHKFMLFVSNIFFEMLFHSHSPNCIQSTHIHATNNSNDIEYNMFVEQIGVQSKC